MNAPSVVFLRDTQREPLGGVSVALVTLLSRGPEWESGQPFLIEKGEIKVKSTEETPYHSPAVTFAFSRNNKDSVVLPHTTNAHFSSFEITVLGAHRNLSIS